MSCFVGAMLVLPGTAGAVTIREIVQLTKAGSSDDVIVALIEHDRTLFDLTGDQILALKRDGVSEAVVLAMLRSAPLDPAGSAAVPQLPADDGPGSAVVNGSARPYCPDTSVAPGPVSYGPAAFSGYIPYIVPYPVSVDPRREHRHGPLPASVAAPPPAFTAVPPAINTGFAPVTVAPSTVSSQGIFFADPRGAAGIFFTNPHGQTFSTAQPAR